MIIDIESEEQFEQLFNEHYTKKLLIDFYASWCEPCKNLSSILTEDFLIFFSGDQLGPFKSS